MRIYTICVALMFASIHRIWAQDPMFSQFHAAPLQLNPALTGVVDAPVLHLNYRNQWAGINNAYATYAASFSQYSASLRSGFGVSMLADVAGNGIYNTTQVGGSYAYDIRFSDNFYIRTGLEANFVNKRLNWNKLVFLDQINPETGAYDSNGNLNPTAEAQANNNVNYFDLGMGMLVKAEYWYGGFSLKHLNAPNEGFYRTNAIGGELPMRITLHGGAEIPLNKHNKRSKTSFLSPNVLFVKQRQFHQLNIGAYIEHESFFGGIWFRHVFGNSDATIISAGFKKGVIKVGYSYDLTVSRLTAATGGTHEISLILNFEDKAKKHRQRYNDCLKIFR